MLWRWARIARITCIRSSAGTARGSSTHPESPERTLEQPSPAAHSSLLGFFRSVFPLWLSRVAPSLRQVGIRLDCGEPLIFRRPTNGEVVQALKLIACESEQLMKDIVEITADAGRAHARGLGLQIQDVSQNSGLPEEPTIPPGAVSANALSKVGDHAQAEGAVGGNLLMAARHARRLT